MIHLPVQSTPCLGTWPRLQKLQSAWLKEMQKPQQAVQQPAQKMWYLNHRNRKDQRHQKKRKQQQRQRQSQRSRWLQKNDQRRVREQRWAQRKRNRMLHRMRRLRKAQVNIHPHLLSHALRPRESKQGQQGRREHLGINDQQHLSRVAHQKNDLRKTRSPFYDVFLVLWQSHATEYHVSFW